MNAIAAYIVFSWIDLLIGIVIFYFILYHSSEKIALWVAKWLTKYPKIEKYINQSYDFSIKFYFIIIIMAGILYFITKH
jgi:hypothetical protein